MNELKNNLKYFPILILPLGCIGVSSAFQVISIIIALLCYFKLNIKYDYKNFFANKNIKTSFVVFFIWTCCISIADIFAKDNIMEFSEGWHYFQRILPFFLVGFFSVNNDKFFKFFWYGICIILFLIDLNVFYNFYVQGNWRPITMFNSPNKLGGFIILVLPFFIAGFYKFFSVNTVKYITVLIFLSTIASLFISGSRGALLGLLGGYLIAIAFTTCKKYGLKRFLFTSIVLSFLILLIFYLIYSINTQFVFRDYDVERVYLWQSTIKMILDYPIFGIGGGEFKHYYISNYISPFAKENLTSPHNIFLYFLVERGIVGGGTFILLFVTQLYILYKHLFDKNKIVNIWAVAGFVSVLGMGIHGMVDTQITMRTYSLMYWLLYGLACYGIVYEEQNNG